MTVVGQQHTIINSTFSGNKTTQAGATGAAIQAFADQLQIINSTIAANTPRSGGGALAASWTPTQIKATVFEGNLGGNCTSGAGAATKITTLGYNISSDGTCAAALTGPNDLNNTSARLGPLRDNGGPTPTHALLGASPAINRVPLSLCPAPATDQRWVMRPQGTKCDSGSYEAPGRPW